MKPLRIALYIVVLGAPGVALASETITYTYDHQGRLTNVAHAGTVNDGLNAKYWYDDANNRTRTKVSGSPNSAPTRPAKPKT